MSNVVEKTTDFLIAELDRLNGLSVQAGERMKESIEVLEAECARAKAVNDAAKNIIGLGELYVHAQMLQMNTPEREFAPGAFFREQKMIDVNKPNLVAQTANAWGDGAKTRMNALGEFEDGD